MATKYWSNAGAFVGTSPDGFVPYTGAVASVVLGAFHLSATNLTANGTLSVSGAASFTAAVTATIPDASLFTVALEGAHSARTSQFLIQGRAGGASGTALLFIDQLTSSGNSNVIQAQVLGKGIIFEVDNEGDMSVGQSIGFGSATFFSDVTHSYWQSNGNNGNFIGTFQSKNLFKGRLSIGDGDIFPWGDSTPTVNLNFDQLTIARKWDMASTYTAAGYLLRLSDNITNSAGGTRGFAVWDVAGTDKGFITLGGDIQLVTGIKSLYGDSAIGIYSQANTFLDLFADGAVRIGDSSAGAPTNYVQFVDGNITQVSSSNRYIEGKKFKLTLIGGYAVLLTNKTGVNSVAGKLVKASTATDDAVVLTASGDDECFGAFADNGIPDGSGAWVVVAGIADISLDDNVEAIRGNWMATGAAGYARTQGSPPALGIAAHFEEIGHCVESVAAGGGGTHILARCVLHFN